MVRSWLRTQLSIANFAVDFVGGEEWPLTGGWFEAVDVAGEETSGV